MTYSNYCYCRTHFSVLIVAITVAGAARPCRAVHFDYLVEQDPSGRLVTGSNNFDTGNTLTIPDRVFDRDLDASFFGTDPGFSAVSPINVPAGYSALPPNTPLSLDLLAFSLNGGGDANLWYWNGTGSVNFQPVTDGTSFKLYLGNFSATVTGAAAGVPGFVVQTTDATGAMHRHPSYQLQGTQSEGVYLIAEHTRMPGLTSSIPFFSVFVTDAFVADPVYDSAVAWANHNLVVPGDVNTDGIVDISDVQTIAAHWMQTSPGGDTNYIPTGDANYDRVVDISDVQTIAAHWMQTASSGGGGSLPMVPEPAGLPLTLGAIAVLLAGLTVARRRKASYR